MAMACCNSTRLSFGRSMMPGLRQSSPARLLEFGTYELPY
jgi:hypothetical protein